MTKTEKHFSFFKSFFLLAMCICLTVSLYMQAIKSTAAYVTSLSATCVNTFTEDVQTDPEKPIEPEKPEETTKPSGPSETDKPSAPSTGDNSHIGWYIVAMMISMAAMAVIFFWSRKKVHTAVSNKEEKTRRRK